MKNITTTFLNSILNKEQTVHKTEDILEWIQQRNQEVRVSINEIPFNRLKAWYINNETGSIHHESGKFFSIEGVHIKLNDSKNLKEWSQPIINQPEIGYLGFLVKKINGVLHFLVQAKIEPGNVNNVQLSPTIQATRSNFSRVHKGKAPTYLEYFVEKRGRVIIDQLQSEQGARFFRKRNRNIIIEVEEEIPPHEDFRWMTLGQIKELLKNDNVVNMDTRTVISGISYGNFNSETVSFIQSFLQKNLSEYSQNLLVSYVSEDGAFYSMNDLQSWLTELKSKYELQVKLIPINTVNDWVTTSHKIHQKDHKYFEVIAVDVEIENREVARWNQPIIKPVHEGIVAFIIKKINGIYHCLVQAKLEVGNLDIVELAPTVQCITGNYRKGENEYEVPFLDYVLNARKEQIMQDVMLSEEGGRFYRNQNRNMVILAENSFDEKLPENYTWMTLNQIMQFMQHNNYVNIEARSLLSVLSFE